MNQRALFLTLALVFMEWLDFSLYLYLAKSIFAQQFFSPESQSLILTFAIFAAAYLARPIGGWLFGRKADQSGRRKPMVYSAALMSASTLGICLLPGYTMIGSWAAWGLLLFRIGQGLALGGEVNTSAMFLVEHHRHRPLFAGSLIAMAGAIGMFAGGALAAVIVWLDWSGLWRLVFMGLGFLSLWVCFLRKFLEESPEFLQQPQIKIERWQTYWSGILNIAAVAGFVSVSVYICNVFWVSFAIDQALMGASLCAWTGAFAQLLAALLALPIVLGSREDQVYSLMKASMLLMAAVAPALFYSTAQGWLALALVSVAGYALANALLCSSLYYFLYLQLPLQFRCSGISIVWGLAASAGAVALPIAQKAVQGGQLWLPATFVTMTALFAVFLLQFTQARSDSGFTANPVRVITE